MTPEFGESACVLQAESNFSKQGFRVSYACEGGPERAVPQQLALSLQYSLQLSVSGGSSFLETRDT